MPAVQVNVYKGGNRDFSKDHLLGFFTVELYQLVTGAKVRVLGTGRMSPRVLTFPCWPRIDADQGIDGSATGKPISLAAAWDDSFNSPL